MRVRDHIVLSTAGSALLAPWLGRGVVGLWVGAVLIDADHYVWFCIHQRELRPRAAVRFFTGANPPQTWGTRVLHQPIAVLAVLALAARRRELRSFALGLTTHVALDVHYEVRMNKARAEALARDRSSCQVCGAHTQDVETHLFRQPWLLPDYGARNLVSLCGPCHEVAHERTRKVPSWS